MTVVNFIESPFPLFNDRAGDALESGYIYVGLENLDPETVDNQITLYWDSSLSVVAEQPVRTIGGYPSFNGSPGKLYIVAKNYSITVRDKQAALVYFSANSASTLTSLEFDTIAELIADAGSSDGQRASILGYDTKDDGGGGLFYWDETSSAAQDLRNIFETTAGGVGRWIRISTTNETYNVENLAELIAIDTNASNSKRYVRVGGFYAANDLGGGLFRYNATGLKSTHNGITIISPQQTGVAPGAAGWWTAPLTGADGVWERIKENDINVCMAGAKGDSATDDTLAIQAALNLVKGADATGIGRSVFRLYFPTKTGNFYKITDTLVIDGTQGAVFYGDAARYQRASTAGTASASTIIWYGASSKPIFEIKGGATSVSNPNFSIVLRDITVSGYQIYLDYANPATIPAAIALAGVYIGALDGQNEASSNRMVTISNVNVVDCRFGIYGGAPDGLNTDNAPVNIEKCFIERNAQAGIYWGTGNAIAHIKDCYISGNGWGTASFGSDDYSAVIGANVHVVSGYVDIENYISAGAGTSKPKDADIYQQFGRVSVVNAWSDTHGYFFYQGGGGSNIAGGMISGVRHFSADMTDVNTPNSLHIVNPGMTINSCLLFGNAVVTSGQGGRPVFSGINFVPTDGAGHLVLGTFTGDGVQTERSVINIGSNGNFAQIAMGGSDVGVPFKHIGNLPPQILSMGGTVTGGIAKAAILQALGGAATDSPVTVVYGADGSINFLNNCLVLDTSVTAPYTSPTYTPSLVTAPCWSVKIGGATSCLTVRVFDPGGAVTAFEDNDFVEVFQLLSGTGNGFREEVSLSYPQRAADPTFSSGDYWEGTSFFDTVIKALKINTRAVQWETNLTTFETTTAELADVTDTINTVGKFAGRMVWDGTTGLPMFAQGALAASTWVDGAGGGTVSPV